MQQIGCRLWFVNRSNKYLLRSQSLFDFRKGSFISILIIGVPVIYLELQINIQKIVTCKSMKENFHTPTPSSKYNTGINKSAPGVFNTNIMAIAFIKKNFNISSVGTHFNYILSQTKSKNACLDKSVEAYVSIGKQVRIRKFIIIQTK